ncbi:hypothetical protein [Marixanthomonas ophiurae]|uniref:Uncharacterized protein n=1 Tax=Marixanthomonas ophiurae TaxID=387659 RepID=A0A3E1Q9G7_9FLAO|nr:hypothetical protein [Marixanthomonas ophiurae]RFN58754.1 hypothetical protein DZ858_01340 [Marixanthomonas ophiurae]
MKKSTQNNIFFSVLLSIFSISVHAQVGIGTTTPEGMLDLESSSSGFVFPNVALTARNRTSPVKNPNGGTVAEGTAVYNTSTTQTGANDVYPGIYVWDGNKWIAQYIKEDSQKFEQSPLEYRVPLSGGHRAIPGLGNQDFIPKYSGTYRIEANFNFGAGEIKDPTGSNSVRMGTQEGYIKLRFDGVNYNIYTHAYSIKNDLINGGTDYEAFRHDSSLILYEDLKAGQAYPFLLTVDVQVAGEFNTDAYVGIDLPCTVEFTFLEE